MRLCSFHASGGKAAILAKTVAELEVETLAITRGDVQTKRVVYKQVNSLTTARRES